MRFILCQIFLTLLFSLFERKFVVKGKILESIYWNTTNTRFDNSHYSIDADLEDKLDIICPMMRKDTNNRYGWYYKIYLVNQHSYNTCNASSGRRLINCDSPTQEKKYTFYFQEISPSPWALEFEPDKTYYIISTSDGTYKGLNKLSGGSCVKNNMKVQIRVRSKKLDFFEKKGFKNSKKTKDKTVGSKKVVEAEQPDNSIHTDKISTTTEKPRINKLEVPSHHSNQMMLGIAVGAGVVTFILIFVFIGYRVYTKKRKQNPKRCISYQSSLPSQVTLLPVQTVRSCSQVNLTNLKFQRTPNNPLTRSPPPYNESYLDNGGTVVVV